MHQLSSSLKLDGKKIGLVPTMGFLHEGHISLIKKSRSVSDITIVSIFINPAQFAPTEDFNQYPRDLERDKKILEENDVDYLFLPDQKEIYTPDFQTYVEVTNLTKHLEGEFRPTHFKGVTTIVSILLNCVKPDFAIFGQKDAQQAAAIKQMVKNLKYDLEILLCPIIRETDGLALSSRNIYLTPDDRTKALLLNKSLLKAKEVIDSGERNVKKIVKSMNTYFAAEKTIHLNYIRIVKAEDFIEAEELEEGENYYVLIAAKIGNVRLIDNILISQRGS
jgi:pantoate--beta-alanine ligase